MKRRTLIQSMAAFSFWGGAAIAALPKKHLIIIILRGGMDGLAVVPPYGDPTFNSIRNRPSGMIELDSFFGLHPALSSWLPLWKKQELSIIHAVGLTDASRSHFSAQDLLEQGDPRAKGGWLGRSIEHLFPSTKVAALGHRVPMILHGAKNALSMSPSRRKYASEELLSLAQMLYSEDRQFQSSLEQSLLIREQAGGHQRDKDRFATLRGLIKFIRQESSIGVIEIGGWDTHANQNKRIHQRLKYLADSMQVLRQELDQEWQNTAVLAVSEFGRSVEMNGTGGTDHGHGGAAFLLGGAISGGKIHSKWPGLRVSNRHKGRDLAIGIDIRSVYKGILKELYGADRNDFNKVIFPSLSKYSSLQL